MYIRERKGVAWPYSLNQLKKDYPTTSFPKEPSEELLATYDVYLCTSEPMPEYDSELERVTLGEPVKVDGVWVQQWTIVAIPDEELAARVRGQRDRYLNESDWTQVSDSPLYQDDSWLEYRTSLRNITTQPGFPKSVVWPVEPTN